MLSKPTTDGIKAAHERLKGIVKHTPLEKNINLSEKYDCNIYLKREDLQVVRSYKIRGAYNKMAQLSALELSKGVVCASAGNHAQGVAYACQKLEVNGIIFMPTTTPAQKVRQVNMFGKGYVKVVLVGDTFDDAFAEANEYCTKEGATFVHPFEDTDVMEGQGTVGLEILDDTEVVIDFLLFAIGGGGLSSGVSTIFKNRSPLTKLMGVEPLGSPTMKTSIEKGEVVALPHIDKFVDGAAVKKAGETTFSVCQENLDDILIIHEGKICSTILSLYNEEAIVAEPAGSLSIAALDEIKDQIKGKNVVCIIGGGNNDIVRMEEIRERSLLYEGLKHYFIIKFPQRRGAMRDFLEQVLGPKDDIVFFEYSKKTARERGPALVGIEIPNKDHLVDLQQKMLDAKFQYTYLNDKPELFEFLV